MSERLDTLRTVPRARHVEARRSETTSDWFLRILSEALGPNPLDAIFPADSNLGLRR